MKFATALLLLSLVALQIEGKKRAKPKEHEVTDVEAKDEEKIQDQKPHRQFGFAFNPFGMALQIPIISPDVFGSLQNQMKRLREAVYSGRTQPEKETQLMDEDGKKVPLKTRTKTSNSTHGPFKTYTITKETVSAENKTNPKVFSKSVQSITTLDKKFKGKIPKGQKEKFSKMLFNFGPMQLRLKEIDQKPQCSSKEKCGKHKYCDAITGQCTKHRAPGSPCTQEGQCENRKGRQYRCTWGRCIINTKPGSAGTFCKDESSCQSDERDTEMCCQPQPDISHFTKVCLPKLNEGATCGHASIFDAFRQDEEQCGLCKTGLECKRVALFTGRKICLQNSVAKSFDDVSKKSSIARMDKMEQQEPVSTVTEMEQMDEMAD